MKTEFCPDCPSRALYVGSITVDNLKIESDNLKLKLRFVDSEGISSSRMSISSGTSQYSSEQQPADEALIQAIDDAKEAIIGRIALCKCSGQRVCPAFSDRVVEKLVKNVTNIDIFADSSLPRVSTGEEPI